MRVRWKGGGVTYCGGGGGCGFVVAVVPGYNGTWYLSLLLPSRLSLRDLRGTLGCRGGQHLKRPHALSQSRSLSRGLALAPLALITRYIRCTMCQYTSIRRYLRYLPI